MVTIQQSVEEAHYRERPVGGRHGWVEPLPARVELEFDLLRLASFDEAFGYSAAIHARYNVQSTGEGRATEFVEWDGRPHGEVARP